MKLAAYRSFSPGVPRMNLHAEGPQSGEARIRSRATNGWTDAALQFWQLNWQTAPSSSGAREETDCAFTDPRNGNLHRLRNLFGSLRSSGSFGSLPEDGLRNAKAALCFAHAWFLPGRIPEKIDSRIARSDDSRSTLRAPRQHGSFLRDARETGFRYSRESARSYSSTG